MPRPEDLRLRGALTVTPKALDRTELQTLKFGEGLEGLGKLSAQGSSRDGRKGESVGQ